MARLLPLTALAVLASGCTTTGLTRTAEPHDCVAFVAEPDWHHGFEGAGMTRAFLDSGDTLTVWAARGVHDMYYDLGLGDSIAVYTRPVYEDDQVPAVVPLAAIRVTERRWRPLDRWVELLGYPLGFAGIIAGLGVADALGADEPWQGYVAMYGGAAVGVAASFGTAYSYQRVSRCEVVP